MRSPGWAPSTTANRLTADGLSPTEAALRTWTGQRAVEAGYGEVVVRVLEGEAGAYDEVLFTRT